MAQQLLLWNALIQKRPDDEVRRTQEIVRQLILGLFAGENVFLKGVLVVGRKCDVEATALVVHDLVREASVRVRPLEDCRNPKTFGGQQRVLRTERPGVNDVDFVRDARQPLRDDPVVEPERSESSDRPVRNSDVAARQGRLHLDTGSQRTADGARIRQDARPGSGDPVHLIPGGRTDPVGADLVRKAVEDAKCVGHGSYRTLG